MKEKQKENWNEVYVNPTQDYFMQSKQRFKVIVAGVGIGKTTLIGFHNYMKFNALRGFKSLMAGLTYNQIFNITLPECQQSWTNCGLVEAQKGKKIGHYVIGVRPPDYFKAPFKPPKKFSNVVSFISGYCIQLASLDRPELIRGISVDSLDIDEAAKIKREAYTKVLLPRVRNYHGASKSHLYQSVSLFSNMPYFLEGAWLLDFEKLANKEPNNALFIDAPSKVNKDVLGDKYFENLKSQLSPLEYLVEVENSREHLINLPDCFYPNFEEDKHTYYDTYKYETKYIYDEIDEERLEIKAFTEYINDEELMLSFDFNASMNTCLVAQKRGKFIYFINELYDNSYKTFTDVVAQFIDEYKTHNRKIVYIYGDRNGNNAAADRGELSFYDMIIQQLNRAGWKAILTVKGLDPNHKNKHFSINEMLSERKPNAYKVRINKDKCKFLIVSIRNSSILPDFKKNKKNEANKAIDQRITTHFSDCFDNLVFYFADARLQLQSPIRPARFASY